MQKEHTFKVDGLINGGGLISEIIYSFENGWAYIRGGLIPGGLKSGILRYFDYIISMLIPLKDNFLVTI